MKKNFWKKLLSLVLVAALVVGTLHVNSRMASAAGEDHSTVTTTAGGIQITKKLESMGAPYKNSEGKLVADGQISITLRGTENATSTTTTTSVKSTDIVFVMDISNSMKYDSKGNTNNVAESKQRIYAAKNAAKAFAEGILTDANKNNVRIGVVAFGTSAYKVQDLTNNVANVKNSITDNVKVGYSQDKGGTFIQGGLKTAETMLSGSTAQNKIIVILSDGEPTYSYGLRDYNATGKDRLLNTGVTKALYSSSQFNYNHKSGDGTDTSDKYKTRTISEAYIAKDNNIEIYSIAYDTNKNDGAKYVMQNVASADVAATATAAEKKFFYSATSGQTTNTETAIANVMSSIVTSISETISASGSTLTDKMPSYIKAATGVSAENVAINNSVYGNTVTWSNIGTLAKNDTKTINISVTVDLYAMATAYADSHDEYNSAEEVLAKMASGSNDIWFDMNEQVTFNYTDANGTNGTNTDLGTVQSKVPMEQFTAYNYTIIYREDGEQISKISGSKFAGETVTFADLKAYTDDTVKYDKKSTTTSVNNAYSFVLNQNTEVVVNYYKNTYTVTYVDGITGETVGTPSTYKYGEKFNTASTPDVPPHEGKTKGRWDTDLTANTSITQDYTIKSKYDDVNCTVTYRVVVDGILIEDDGIDDATVVWGGSVASLPTVDKDLVGAVDVNTDSLRKEYTELGWTLGENDNAILSGNQLTDIKSDVTLTKEFKSDSKIAVRYEVRTIGDDTDKVYTDKTQWVADKNSATAPDLSNYSETSDNTKKFNYSFVTDGNNNIVWTETYDNGVIVFTAERTSTYINYSVTFTFTDAEGKVKTETADYHYGDTPSLPESMNDIKATEDTDEWDYTFTNWAPVFTAIEPDDNGAYVNEYNASETKQKQQYTYKFTIKEEGKNDQVITGTVPYGEIVNVPQITVPTVTGYSVTVNKTANWPNTDTVEITENLDATATITYAADDCTVKISYVLVKENGLESSQTLLDTTVKYDSSVSFPLYQVKVNGAEFSYTMPEITGTVNGVSASFNGTDFICSGNTEIVIKQVETRNTVTVTFVIDDVDDIYTLPGKEVTVPYGKNVNAADIPSLSTVSGLEEMADGTDGVKNGLKWTYTVNGFDSSKLTNVTENITVTATITKVAKTYTVIYRYDRLDGTSETTTYTNVYGTPVSAPALSALDNTDEFTYGIVYGEGWNDTVITGDATYVATETKSTNNYKVNFVIKYTGDENKEVTVATVTVPYGATATAPAIGAEFLKENTAQWSYPEASGVKFSDCENVVKDTIVTIVYPATLNQYTVEFFDEDGQTALNTNITFDYGTEFESILDTIVEPTKSDSKDGHFSYYFKEWVAMDGKTVTFPAIVTENLQYKAYYANEENTYTVTFRDEDETYFDEVSLVWGQSVLTEEDAKPTYDNAVAKANAVADSKTSNVTIYHFGYWAIYNADGTTSVADLSQPVTSDLTVYARYTSCAHDDYKITYHAANYEDVVFTDSATPGKSYTVNTELAPAKASTDTINYTFLGWSYEKQYTTISDNNLVVKEIRPLAAKGGFGTPESVLREADKFVDGLLVKIGYIERDVDLYPVYASSERLYTVTFHNYDGEVIDTCTDIHYGEAATAPAATPSRASVSDATSVTTYTFKGWDKDFSVVTEDMDVYAQFDSVTTPIHIIPILPPVTPTPEPTATPTPTPVPEIIPIEEPEVPEGEPIATPTPEPTATPTPEVIEVIEEPETPEGTPDEEIEIELDETPQGLPKTGAVAAGVLYGIGSACILLGSVLTSKFKKKEEE